MHAKPRTLYPDARFPRFDCARRSDGGLEMVYRSELPLADFAAGLIRG